MEPALDTAGDLMGSGWEIDRNKAIFQRNRSS
jgi:hypothetical protein